MSRLSGVWCFVLIFFSFSCSTSETATTDTGIEKVKVAESKYPEWFDASGFMEDSLSFHGFATAISSDSVKSVSNAQLKARTNLEQRVSEEMESVRQDLEKNGSSVAATPDFILVLSNAINEIDENAEFVDHYIKKEEEHYRAFVQTRITKTQLKALLEAGFEGKESYWEEIFGSEVFLEKTE